MDDRLLPLNAFIGLCVPDHLWPSPLAEVGYRLVGLEIPVTVESASLVIDAVVFREEESSVLATEAKSGKNVKVDQADRYGQLDADGVIRSASVTVTHAVSPSVQPVFVCLEEHAERILVGLEKSTTDPPVLCVGEERIEHQGADFQDPDLQARFGTPPETSASPPRYVTVDVDSPTSQFEGLVLATLVESLSHGHPQITVSSLAERSLRFLPMYGTRIRNRLIERIDDAARRVAATDPDSFRYVPRTGARPDAVIEFVRDPEAHDLRGRTQSYQAIARARPSHGRRRREAAGQASFDELLAELDRASGLDDDEGGGE